MGLNVREILNAVALYFPIGMVIRNLTLPGAMEGVTFYLKPDFSKITPNYSSSY